MYVLYHATCDLFCICNANNLYANDFYTHVYTHTDTQMHTHGLFPSTIFTVDHVATF